MPISASATRILRFDSFELNLRAGELRKSGVKLRLQGLPIQLLAILLQSSGNLVTREELRTQLWPADTFVDFDHGLNNAISRIREMLGDSAEAPRYVETLSRRGYRFIAQVEEIGAPVPVPAIQPSEAIVAPVRMKGIGIRRTPVLTLSIIGVAAACVFWFVPSVWHRVSAAPLHSIAVLPLENLSGDPSQSYLVDGMTDQLITDLAQIGSLRVISRTSVMRYKGSKESLPEIARELNVDSIVEGSVTRSGKQVRITAQLLKASTDEHLWAESYERDLGDVLRMQSDVAQAIAQQVRAELSPQQIARFRSAPSVDPDAYQAYLRGRYLFTTYFSSGPQLIAAKSYFEESIRKDPNFAPAYAGLADSYIYLAFVRQLPPETAYRAAQMALNKAMQLDSSLGEAHDALAVMRWRYDWDWTGAQREFDYTIALAPSYDCAHADYSIFLGFTGRRAQALAEITKSRELNPGSSFDSTESAAFYLLRDYKSLVEASRKGVAADPNDWLNHYYLGVGYEGSGKTADAILQYQKAVELSSNDQDAAAALAHAYAVTGRKSDAEVILRDLDNKSKTAYVSPYMIATIYAGLGDKDNAFVYLEKAYQEKSLDISWAFKSDLRIDNLRSDPRFQSLLQRIHFPDQQNSQS